MHRLNQIFRLFGRKSGTIGTADPKPYRWLVLVYDPATRRAEKHVFTDPGKADIRFRELQFVHLGTSTEVVMFGLESEEALRETHPHYYNAMQPGGDRSTRSRLLA